MSDAIEMTPHIISMPAKPAFYTGPRSPNVFLMFSGREGALIDSGIGDGCATASRWIW